jgi:hypothetical protein
VGIGEICEWLGPVLVEEVTPNICLVCRSRSVDWSVGLGVVLDSGERGGSSSSGPRSTSPLPTYGSTLGSSPSSTNSCSFLYPFPLSLLRRFLRLHSSPSIEPRMRRPPMTPPTIPPIVPPERPEDLLLAFHMDLPCFEPTSQELHNPVNMSLHLNFLPGQPSIRCGQKRGKRHTDGRRGTINCLPITIPHSQCDLYTSSNITLPDPESLVRLEGDCWTCLVSVA